MGLARLSAREEARTEFTPWDWERMGSKPLCDMLGSNSREKAGGPAIHALSCSGNPCCLPRARGQAGCPGLEPPWRLQALGVLRWWGVPTSPP